MQRNKKLSIISVGDGQPRFCCLKYSLMACNAFGIMLGIFVVLFGISYPQEQFPGGYSGKTTAGLSGVFIFFTGIGYCGAHHQKSIFLIFYSLIIIVFLGSNIVVAFISPPHTLFHPATKQFYFMTAIMLLVMGLACFLAYQVKQEPRNLSNSSNSSTNQPPLSQQQQNQPSQLQKQNIQQIQLPQQPQPSQPLQSPTVQQPQNTANGSAHHYQQPSLSAHFHSGSHLLNNNFLPPQTMTLKNQNGYPQQLNQNPNYLIKTNVNSQMPGVYVQVPQPLPAIPQRYSQSNGYS